MNGVFLRALLFSLLLNIPTLGGLYLGGCASPSLISDIDEVCYLPRALDIGHEVSPIGFYREHQGPISSWDVLLNEPYSLPDVLLGSAAARLQLPPLCFGLLLDLAIAAIVYLIFALCFRQLTSDSLTAECAAAAFLLFPWSFSLDQHFETKLPWFSFLVSSKIYGTSSLPVLRGVATQISYVFYGLFLVFLMRAHLEPISRPKNWILAGLFSGALVHLYFFGWVTSIVLTSVLFLARLLFRPFSQPSLLTRSLRDGFAFFFSHGVVAVSGMLVMLYGKGLHRVTQTPELRHYWYFSVEVSVVLLVFSLALFLHRSSEDRRTWLALAIGWSVLVSQFFLMNLQPVLGSFITPFRFVQLYLQPLMSGILILLLISRLNQRGAFRRIVQLCAVAILVIIGVEQGKSMMRVFAEQGTTNELSETLAAIQSHTPPNAVIAVASARQFYETTPLLYSWRALPNIVNATTRRPILHQHWILPAGIEPQETLGRELFSAWLFIGKTQLYFPCTGGAIAFPGDIFSLTWTGHLVSRGDMCRQYPELGAGNVDVCSLLRQYSVDYVLVEKDIIPTFPPPLLADFYREVWKGNAGKAALYSFDQSSALRTICPEIPVAPVNYK